MPATLSAQAPLKPSNEENPTGNKMESILIETKEMTKVYGESDAAIFALAGINLQVRSGEFVAIMGHSGSGKST